ncbi:hypothetical protein SEUCBS139899_009119 [Sporothrix eucalyptigena]
MSTLDVRVGKTYQNYRIRHKIGSGSFGDIYLGTDIVSGDDIVIKLESKDNHHQLEHEARVYKTLTGGVGIPLVRWYGTECGDSAMVRSLLGPSLEGLFNFCNRKFSLKTVLMLADQLISRLEYIHAKCFLHRDIKPNNFLVGIGKRGNQVNVINFGLAKNYRHTKTHDHIPYRENKKPVGTARYASINSYLGNEQSRRDDMEALGHVLLYFCRGSLPWDENIKEKLTTSTEVLCRGLPEEFNFYLKYTRSLDFEDKPDYSYLRKIFRDLFVREGFQYDYVFDWTAASCTPGPSTQYPGIELHKTPPTTHNQLDIYGRLKNLEIECFERAQRANNDPQNVEWQALSDLYRTLLDELQDFMTTSQHPSALADLRCIAQDRAIPERVWKHVQRFMTLLHRHRPASLEYMIKFLNSTNLIFAHLYETVPAFDGTWAECLGDLSRYRMAIEDNQRLREAWTADSHRWYSLASDQAPTTGRFYHHLAIVARPFVITQMYYYVKSLCVPIPYTPTRQSIMTLLDTVLGDPVFDAAAQHEPPVELAFIRAHAILFQSDVQTTPEFAPAISLASLDAHIALSGHVWTQTGVHMAVVNSCALLNYGGDDNVLMKVLRGAMNRSATDGDDGVKPVTADNPAPFIARQDQRPAVADPGILKALLPVQKLVTQIDRMIFSRMDDASCHGYIHARLVFMLCMAGFREGMVYVEHGFPWKELVATLNDMMLTCENIERVEQDVFMQPQVDRKAEEEKKIKDVQLRQQQQQVAVSDAAGDNNLFVPEPPNADILPPPPARSDEDKPLPDDWFLRGLLWADYNFPPGWFANMESIDNDERLIESNSTRLTRKKRVLWMACRLAIYNTWITYDSSKHKFYVTEAFHQANMDK